MAVLAMLRRPFYLPSGEEVVSGWEPCLPQPTEEQDADHLRAALTANGVYLSADQLPAGGLPPLWEYKVDGKAADNGLFHLRFFPFWEKKLPGKRGQFHLVKFDIQKFSKEANTVAAMKAFVLASPPPASVPCKQLVRMAQSSVARTVKPSTEPKPTRKPGSKRKADGPAYRHTVAETKAWSEEQIGVQLHKEVEKAKAEMLNNLWKDGLLKLELKGQTADKSRFPLQFSVTVSHLAFQATLLNSVGQGMEQQDTWKQMGKCRSVYTYKGVGCNGEGDHAACEKGKQPITILTVSDPQLLDVSFNNGPRFWRGPHSFISDLKTSSMGAMGVSGEVKITYNWEFCRMQVVGSLKAKDEHGQPWSSGKRDIFFSGSAQPKLDSGRVVVKPKKKTEALAPVLSVDEGSASAPLDVSAAAVDI